MSEQNNENVQHVAERRQTAIDVVMALALPESVHEANAVRLVGGILMERARMVDNGDEYGIQIWWPDGWVSEFDIGETKWRVTIEEVG